MNNHFTCLIIIFTLLILLITFGEYLKPNGWSYLLSSQSNSISPESIIKSLRL